MVTETLQVYNIAGEDIPYRTNGICQATIYTLVGARTKLFRKDGTKVEVEITGIEWDLSISYVEVDTLRKRKCYWYRFWRRQNRSVS